MRNHYVLVPYQSRWSLIKPRKRPPAANKTAVAVMKRRSGQHRADKRKQARAEEPSGPIIRDGGGFTHLELPPTQVLLLLLATAAAAVASRSADLCAAPDRVNTAVSDLYWLCIVGGHQWLPGGVRVREQRTMFTGKAAELYDTCSSLPGS